MSFVHVMRGAMGLLGLVAMVSWVAPSAHAQVMSAPSVMSAPWTGGLSSTTEVTPNDPRWAEQWYLRQVGAPQAWTVSTGTRQVIVAVIDGGVDITHPDLRDNVWTNQYEIPWDKIDNDHNGYVDDVNGWNFVLHSPDVRSVFQKRQSEDAWSHGTMVASLIGAKGHDGVGMAGVVWNVRLMSLVVLDGDGSGSTRSLVSALRYAVNQGASVINLSLVGYERDPALEEMMERAANAGVVIVAATGNDDTSQQGIDLDETPSYPACSDLGRDVVIGVGGTDVLDQHAPFTNFGKRCTDLSAPAHALLVARPSYPHNAGILPEAVPKYREGVVGTSLAAPLVSGAAALLKSAHPDWSAEQIRRRLYETADQLDAGVASGTKGVYGYGRLNIGRALMAPPPAATPSLAIVSASSTPPTSASDLSVTTSLSIVVIKARPVTPALKHKSRPSKKKLLPAKPRRLPLARPRVSPL